MSETPEKVVGYLCDAAAALPDTLTYLPIKNHFLWLCHAKGGILENKFVTCPHCMHKWSDGKFSFQIQQDIPPGPKMSAILRKYNRSSSSLNLIQKKLLLRHMNRRGNLIVLNCHICKKDTKINMKKPMKQKSQREEATSESKEPCQYTKKRKKKDHYVGLNASAVLSANSSSLPKKKLMGNKKFHEMKPSASQKNSDEVNQSNSQFIKQIITQHKAVRDSKETENLGHKVVHHPQSYRNKIRSLQEMQKERAHQATVKSKAITKRNEKLKNFLNSNDKTCLEDRIKSLLG